MPAIRTSEELLRSIVKRVRLLERRLTVRGGGPSPTQIAMSGEIKAWLGDTAPEGWALCRGGTASRTDAAGLFALIGTKFGAGDGATTFGLPDYRGRMLVGLNPGDTAMDVVGEVGGTATHLHSLPNHAHALGGTGYALAASDTSYLWISNIVVGLWTANRRQTGAGAGVSQTGIGGGINLGGSTGSAGAGNSGSASSYPPFGTINYIVKL